MKTRNITMIYEFRGVTSKLNCRVTLILFIILLLFANCDNQKSKKGFIKIESENSSIELEKESFQLIDLPHNIKHRIEQNHANDQIIKLISFHPTKQERILGEEEYGENYIDTSIIIVKVFLLNNGDTSQVNYLLNDNMEIIFEFDE